MSATFLMIKTGSTYPELAADRGDFEDWITAGMGLASGDVQVIDVQGGAPLPDLTAPHAVVITGSHDMVTDRAPWSEATAGWLAAIVPCGWPILGICYGHQLLAHACGGQVGPGVEMGRALAVRYPDAARDPLFSALPDRFYTLNGHFQAVLALPPGAIPLVATSRDPHHALRVGECAWGIQWHPEIDVAIAAAYVRQGCADLEAAGVDVAAVLDGLAPTPRAAGILKRFVDVAQRQLSRLREPAGATAS